MRELATSFVKKVRDLCTTSSVIRSKLDRPNTHRLLELYCSTIPHFSHALFFADMGFESNHQPLKSALSRDTNINSHISSVYHVLARDWFSRVCEHSTMWSILNPSDHVTSNAIRRSLRRLFFGDHSQKLDNTIERDAKLLKEMDDRIEYLLSKPLIKRLQTWYSSTLTSWSDGKWVSTSLSTSSSKFCSEHVSIAASRKLSYYLEDHCIDSISFHSSSSFTQNIGETIRRRYNHHKLLIGDVFECFTQYNEPSSSYLVTPSLIGYGERTVWLLQILLGDRNGNLWTLATRGEALEEGSHSTLFKFDSERSTTTTLVKMESVVRKAFAIHACDVKGTCTLEYATKTFSHCINRTSPTYFRVISRRNGYPSRRA